MKRNVIVGDAPSVKLHTLLKIVVLAILFIAPQKCLQAALRTWTGGGTNANWTTPGNWGGTAPSPGDDLVFPAGASRLVNTNDFGTGTVFGSITFSGSNYVIRGKDIVLTNGINGRHVSGTNWLHIKIVLGATQTIECDYSSAALILCTDGLGLGRYTALFSSRGYIECPGVISGTGGVTKNGTGTLAFSGSAANTYLGSTTVEAGTLLLKKSGATAISGSSLIIGDGMGGTNADVVRLQANYQIADTVPITITNSGLLDLNGYNDTVGTLVFGGGRAETDSGVLTLNGDVQFLESTNTAYLVGQVNLGSGSRTFIAQRSTTSAYPTARIEANLSGPADIAWLGISIGTPGIIPVIMNYGASNSYTGQTTISNLTLYVDTPWALGDTNSGTIVKSLGNLSLNGSRITNETCTLEYRGTLDGGITSAWCGPVVLAGDARIHGSSGSDFEIRGAITGTGNLTVNTFGVVRFSGTVANSYSGTTYLQNGILELGKTSVANGAIPGDLVIGTDSYPATNRLLYANQIANTAVVTVNAQSRLDLNGRLETIGGLALNGGVADSGTGGTLRLLGNIAVSNSVVPSTINGLFEATVVSCSITTTNNSTLYLNAAVTGSSSFYKRGNGYLFLRGTNSYSGLTVIEDGVTIVENSQALGTTTSGTIVSNGAALVLRTSVTNETITLNGEGPFSYGALDCDKVGNTYWVGSIMLETDSEVMTPATNTTLHLVGPISGPGGLIKEGQGTVVLSGGMQNTFAGETWVREGTLLLAKSFVNGALTNRLIIGDGIGGPNADVVRLVAGSQIGNDTAIVINSSGLWDLNGYGDAVGSIEGPGNIHLGSGGGFINVGMNNRDTVFNGVISGYGDINKISGTTGTLVFNGNNTYVGSTYVNGGALIVNGVQPQSFIQVASPGVLGGSGVVGAVNCAGLLTPGASPGILTTSNLAVLGSAVLKVELEGPMPGIDGYDQIRVRGTVNLGNATLDARLGFYSSETNIFTIIDNDGTDAVIGTFAGLPEGATLTINGTPFRISYAGGTGNDVVLTQLSPMVLPKLGIASVMGTNLLVYWSTNFTGYSLWTSTNLSTGIWQLVPGMPTVMGTNYSMSITPADLHRFFRLRLE